MELSFLTSCYSRYREWCKAKGREAKRKRRLGQAAAFYKQFIKPQDLCFDIGANIGMRTEAFLMLGAKVVAVEPQESCCEELAKRFGNNEKFILVAKAVDKVEGYKEFYLNNATTLASMSTEWIEYAKKEQLFPETQWDTKVTVPTTTLDALIEQYGMPAFCKIDVEGFEYAALQGLSKPVRVISFEFHPGYLESCLNCLNQLSQIGDAKYNYVDGESMKLSLPKWVNKDEIIEMLAAMPKDKSFFGDIYASYKMQ